jgi:integrase/recombinase XerD
LRLKTYRSEQLRLDRFLRYQAEEGLGFTEFPAALIERYLDQFSPFYQNKWLSLVRCWAAFLYRKKAVLLPIHQEILSGKVRHRRRTLLSYEQVMQLLHLADGGDPENLRDRAFLEMAYATGMRRAELVALDLPDIDLAAGVVHVGETKNRCHRRVPLTGWARHYLKRYLEEARPQLASPLSSNPALWLKTSGERIYLYQVPKRLARVYQMRKTVGFHATLHQLRHACATHLLKAGASVLAVKELLGHRDAKSTEIYTRITPFHLQQTHRQHHPRNLPGWPKA